ncbi:hypothetical protein C5748_16290 [Phyllobacterium phragmitis]|uniref:Uncharacterized protein n=1 Tax=Phyllobacterium phragmitis TaxID=2670329 RepID=A0A2S9IPD7_9HYPH|nr:hypothetical protein [Phyllobacterium phragmitis]PRD42352.1 hypothetical protein C5748_16290 [Phyllobacterium phragmitis]
MKRIRDSQAIIGSLEGGDAVAALSKEILDTLLTLKELSGDRPKSKVKGSVTLKLDIVVEAGTATFEVDISSKRPKPVRGSSFFWVLDDGSLSTEHPEQINMFAGLRDAADMSR